MEKFLICFIIKSFCLNISESFAYGHIDGHKATVYWFGHWPEALYSTCQTRENQTRENLAMSVIFSMPQLFSVMIN
ncbi:hypothetical protein AFK69_03740 [Xenorhabdus sp. GDc328]|nr:hypothetical protein AFK69_03740 [Xenorhabdus sp. GDc328]